MTAFALQGLTRLDPGTRAALVDEAAALGIGSERADRLLGRACRQARGGCAITGPVAPQAITAGNGCRRPLAPGPGVLLPTAPTSTFAAATARG